MNAGNSGCGCALAASLPLVIVTGVWMLLGKPQFRLHHEPCPAEAALIEALAEEDDRRWRERWDNDVAARAEATRSRRDQDSIEEMFERLRPYGETARHQRQAYMNLLERQIAAQEAYSRCVEADRVERERRGR